MISGQIIIMITTKGKNIFQKNIKEKEDIKKTYNSSSTKKEDEEIIAPRKKKRRQKKVNYNDDVDGDANEVYAYYDPTSPRDNDDDDEMLMIMKKRMLKP